MYSAVTRRRFQVFSRCRPIHSIFSPDNFGQTRLESFQTYAASELPIARLATGQIKPQYLVGMHQLLHRCPSCRPFRSGLAF